MKECLISIIGVMLLITGCGGADDAVDIHSWPELEARLKEQTDSPRHSPFERMFDSRAYRQVLHHGSIPLLREMAGQDRYQHVRLAGFMALQQHSEVAAIDAGLQIWLNLGTDKEGWAVLGDALVFYLTAPERVPLVLQRLKLASQSNPMRHLLWTSLVIEFPFEDLYDWFHKLEEGDLYLSYEAYLADWLWSRAAAYNRPVTDRMRQITKLTASSPGAVRAHFLDRVAEDQWDSPLYKTALVFFLEDEDAFDAWVRDIVRERMDYIRANIELEELRLTDKRRTLIEEALGVKPDERRRDE